ncbi:DUF1080 domain-containing protein [Bremerella cremea]|uniref:DUF1080 domain-containing protein n=1 Tax=Bremerella cremea TaxID=1031537 RepID=A0A368KKA2_9BACT|nr:DUF1080 domain-containing protein [Bremerella cremea]RCS41201.1 DUF1080 domain-containing protein [Bremerella cremea]
MKISLLLTICLFTLSIPSLAAAENDDLLFDGNSFAGWEGNLDWFRVEKESVVAGRLDQEIPRNEFLCTEQEFADFELTLEAKLVGDGKNAGIQFRSKRIPDHHEVIGYQCDMGWAGDKPIWGSLYDESRRRTFLAEGNADKVREVLKKRDFIPLKIRAQGKHIQIWVDEVKTVDYHEENDNIPQSGIIGLQIHAGPKCEAWYRNIRLKKL